MKEKKKPTNKKTKLSALRINAFWKAQGIRKGICLFSEISKIIIFIRQIESQDWSLSTVIKPLFYTFIESISSRQKTSTFNYN